MTTDNWMLILMGTLIAGVFVTKTTHAVLSRVGAQDASTAPRQCRSVRSSSAPNNRDAAQELALLIALDPSRIDLAFTAAHEVHCSIHANPDELLDLANAAGAVIDQAFRERHRWTNWRVVLHLEARTNDRRLRTPDAEPRAAECRIP